MITDKTPLPGNWVLAKFRAAINRIYGARLERVVLFSSRARGEARPDSDYDIAIFLNGGEKTFDRWAELDKLAVLRVKFLNETGAFFDAKPYPAAQYRERSPPHARNPARRDSSVAPEGMYNAFKVPPPPGQVKCILPVLLAAFVIATPGWPVEPMQSAQQNALVQKYCAVCHTDAAKNGGLTLEHYDAGDSNPALAAMLLSKLQNAAMGAAGLGVPDKATRDAWVGATRAQAEGASQWSVTRTEATGSNMPVLGASMVREVTPREPQVGAPVYRLAIGCNLATHRGDIQLTWSPKPQTDRTFFVSADGAAGVSHRLEGRETMGNGSVVTSGLAAATLNAPLALKTLTVSDLFPGETVMFPLSDLDWSTRRQLAACFPVSAP